MREDPTAVKELPAWTNPNGQELRTIGKKVNIEKNKIRESGDPFYEYKVMEKVQGIGWYGKDALGLKEKGYTDEDIGNLKKQAEATMAELQQRFEKAGIVRGWKLKDMVFDIDIKNKQIIGIVPTDWERTKIDTERLEKYKKQIQS